jgi:hypothetical protein
MKPILHWRLIDVPTSDGDVIVQLTGNADTERITATSGVVAPAFPSVIPALGLSAVS